MRIAGTSWPLHTRDHAVILNGIQTHSSGRTNGDRWSLVLFDHASWPSVSKEAADGLRKPGLPCPSKGYSGYNVALPAATDPASILAKAGSSDDPVFMGDDGIVDETPRERKKVVI